MPPLDRSSFGRADARVATSVTLCAAAACVALAAVASIGQWPSNTAGGSEITRHQPKLMQAAGPAPAFCKNQTWPNIDARCLNRAEQQVADAPANTTPASVAPAPAVTTEPPAAPPPVAVDNNAQLSAPAAPSSDVATREPPVAGADSSTVGMSEADVWPAEPTRQPHARSSRRSSGWNLPTSRSAW